MLNSLEFIGNDKPWPPLDRDEADRIAEHVLMRKIYNGLHDEIFPRYAAYLADKEGGELKQVIILDWAELATTTYLNLTFGKPIEIKAKIDVIPERPDSQIVIDASRYGHAAYEVTDEAISILNPENMYLVVSPANIQKITNFVIFAKFKQNDLEGKELEYIKFTIHSKGQIQHLLFELRGSKLAGPLALINFAAFAHIQADENGIQKTKATEDILVVHVQNQLSSERYYGRSDYKPSVLSLIESLEMSFSERDEVQHKFTAPTPVIPDSATVFDHSLGEWVFEAGAPILTMPGDVPPSLMVWDAQLGHVEKAIDQKMEQLLQMLQLSKVLLAGQDAGNAESGTALRFRLIPTMSQVDKHARAMEKAIPQVLNLWSQLHPPIVAIKDIHVKLKDGIPEDQVETAKAAQLWDAMGAISLERKLELQGLKEGSEAYEIELGRLRGVQAALIVPKSRLPPLELNG